MMIPQCYDCKHFAAGKPGLTCPAFPAGIPDAIRKNKHDHREEYPGDNGVRFEWSESAIRLGMPEYSARVEAEFAARNRPVEG